MIVRLVLCHEYKKRHLKREEMVKKAEIKSTEELVTCLEHVQERLRKVFGYELVDVKFLELKTPKNETEAILVDPESSSASQHRKKSSSAIVVDRATNLPVYPPITQTLTSQSSWVSRSILPPLQCLQGSEDHSSYKGLLIIMLLLIAAQKGEMARDLLFNQCENIFSHLNLASIDEVLSKAIREQYLAKEKLSKDDPAIVYKWGARAKVEFPKERLILLLHDIWSDLSIEALSSDFSSL